jgi:hypothetical protein
MIDDAAQTMFIDGCDDAVIGYVERCGEPTVVVYDYSRLCTSFRKQGMTTAEAEEWISFNILGAWVGKGTPAVLMKASSSAVRQRCGAE